MANNIPSWMTPNSIVDFTSTSNNIINPYLHPIYIDVRNKIKNFKPINDYYSVLKYDDDIQPIKINNLNINPNNTNKKLESGEIDLYDTKSFNNNATYMIDVANSFNKNDFLSALRSITKNPLLFINSKTYNPNNDECNLEIVDDDNEQHPSYLQFLDKTNFIPKINSAILNFLK